MEAKACAEELASPVGETGSKFMMDPDTFGAAPDVGMEPNEVFYIVGRFGPVGNASVKDVVNLATFIEPNWMEEIWTKAAGEFDIAKVGERFLKCCADWGRTNLAGIDKLESIDKIAQKVIQNTKSPLDFSLFEILKKVDYPDDIEGRVAILIHTLRELRFENHIKAIRDAKMEPLDAFLAGPSAFMAAMFKWPEPYDEVTEELTNRRQEVEVQTTENSSQNFECLSDDERQELVDSMKRIHASLN